jgi:response regulator of citrate/malate metabolism
MISVLVVDDDFMVARVHRGYVERVPGFRVVGEAHSGADALDAVTRLHPDLVLLDIYLPDMTGLDVLQALRAREDESVDVIAVTAAREVETIRAAMIGGVAQYLVKPFGFAALRERLEQYADARRTLAGMAEPGQDEVDRVFRLMRGAGSATVDATLPKGLSPQTCELVAQVLQEADGDLSAREAAQRAGLSRVSARRYLEHLVEARLARLQLRYGAAGRPEHRYAWVPDDGGNGSPDVSQVTPSG